ncbi:hypothetical protein [Pseudomonas sp. MPR-ANC1]|nr:hypothetical protein [Pseudomonas sp. MPR-ANC1]
MRFGGKLLRKGRVFKREAIQVMTIETSDDIQTVPPNTPATIAFKDCPLQ